MSKKHALFDLKRNKKINMTLDDNEKRFRSLIENSNDVISLIDANGTIIYTSPSIHKVLGYTDQERAGHSIFENIHPEDVPRIKQIFGRLLKAPDLTINETTRYRHQNGEWTWMEGYAKNLLKDPDVQAIVVNFRDITESKQTEIALHKFSHDLNERVKELNCINQVTDILSKNDIALNDKLSRIVNIIPPAFLYPEITTARIELDGNEFKTDNFLKTPWMLTEDIMVYGKQAGIVEISSLEERAQNDEGQFLKEERNLINDIAVNIGQLKENQQAEEALQESEQKFKTLIETANTGYLIIDNEGRVLVANQEYVRLSGHNDLEEILGRKVTEWTAKHDLRRNTEEVKKCMELGYVRNLEIDYKDKRGRITAIEINATVIQSQSGPQILSICRDITDRKQSEEKLKQNAARLEQAEKHAQLGSWEFNVITGKGWWSNSLYQMFGFEIATEIPELDEYLEHIHPDDQKHVRHSFLQMMKGEEPVPRDFKSNPALGPVKHFTPTVNFEKDTKGSILKYIGTLLDITEIRERDEELRVSEAQLSNALKIARAGHWEYDVASDTFTFNDHFYAIFRTTAEKEGGYTMSSTEYARRFVHPDDMEVVGREVQAAIEATDPDFTHELEHRIIFPNGETGHLAVRIFTVKDDKGRTIKTYGVNQDITKRKLSEQNLALLEFAINHAHEASYLMDEDSHFLNVNNEACKALGYTREELLNMKVTDLDPEFTMERWYRYWNKIQKEEGVTLETTHRRKDGSRFPVEVSANYFEYDGKGYDLALARDITERQLAEKSLAKSQQNLLRAQTIAHLGNWEWYPQEDYVTGSKEFFNIFGLESADDGFPLNAFLDRIHPNDLGTVKQIIESILNGASKELNMEYRIVLPGDNIRYVIVQGESIYDEQHKLSHIFGIIQDVTAQKQVEEALRESESRFRLMADSAPVMIWMSDTEGGCIYFNQGWLDFTGKTLEQERGSGWLDGVHPDDRNKIIEVFTNAMEARKPYQIEKRLRCKDGEYCCFLDTGTPRYTSDGSFAGYIGTCIDITEIKQAETAVRESEWRFRIVARATSDIIWDWDLTANSAWWNEGMQTQFGYSPDEIEPGSESWTNRIHPDDLDRVVNGIHAVIDGKADNWTDEYRFRRKDGSYAYIYDRGFVVRNENSEALRMIGGMTDITERKSAENKMLRLNRVYKMLSEINSLIVHVHDKQQLFDEACRIAVEDGEFLLSWVGIIDKDLKQVKPVAFSGINDGYLDEINISLDINSPRGRGPTGRAIHDNKPFIISDIATDPNMKYWREKALARNFRSSVAIPLSVSGEVVGALNLYAREMAFFDEDEIKLLTELASDISYALQNIMQREKLEYISSYDSLTGLPNRKLFLDHLDSVLDRARKSRKKVGLLVCDVKQFRHINNVYGPQVGDLILQEIARRLREHTADPVNIGRITSDYFAMILHDVRDVTGIAYMFENNLFPALSEKYLINNQDIQVNFNGGIAVFPADGNDAEAIYRNAEAALKKAKLSGEKYLFYQPEMTARIIETLQIESKLRIALKEEQFVLHYQPKINSQTHQIIGLEALIRWNDPETGLVPPGKFIPILEETGLILDVGLWALDRAASDYRKWLKMLKSVPRIAVNVSSVQLKQKDFVEQVENAIRRSGKSIPLEIELTESLIMTDIEQNIGKLKALQMAGLQIAIDDFGTGYSSLSYISKLPINSLKIDRSFIMNMTTQPESMTIVSTIITLAHALNFKVVAEGVETEEQAKFLTLLKCDEMQGFLFSKPMPPEDIYELLRSGKIL